MSQLQGSQSKLATRFLTLVILFALSACAPVETVVKSPEQACNELKDLIAAYDEGFAHIKRSEQKTPRLNVWTTNFHFVGNSCEIWEWTNKSSYHCNKTYPDETLAKTAYDSVKGKLQQCLGSQWQLEERPRKLGEGQKATYQKQGQLPAVSLHVVATKAAFKTSWSAYLFIGDPSDQL